MILDARLQNFGGPFFFQNFLISESQIVSFEKPLSKFLVVFKYVMIVM